ncbi:MAG: nicotinate phosphoribosyltransferase, partial [Verrucomicrobia bacterium]|nr:nicotinate phosphoribosyltransferase [Verrucomicrobiota bacterium]
MTPQQWISPALLTDLYQLTMSYGYWRRGMSDWEAVFNLFFRQQPFNGGYTIACGLNDAIEYLLRLKFQDDDLEYLGQLRSSDGALLFTSEFLEYLKGMTFACDIDAVPEGNVVFPHEPLMRIRGPLLQCQLLETALLNILNFQTLIATKAARICLSARGAPVLEFGSRRAQGPDGALAASRAAFVGGCAATSNLLAGKVFKIPVRGTHSHSWVMSFDKEEEAFQAFAEIMPGNTFFLVDTYDSINGVRNAIKVGKWLSAHGKRLLGIRLDSGDLAYLSVQARRMLDAAGFHDAQILASNDLDEYIISSLHEQGAIISQWGVGTKLVTAFDQPALGGVYKMGAISPWGNGWQFRLKLSEQTAKISHPGSLQVRRFKLRNEYVGDLIYNDLIDEKPGRVSI